FQGAAFGNVFGEELEDGAVVAVGHGPSRNPDDGGGAVFFLPFRDQTVEMGSRAEIISEVEPALAVGIEATQVLACELGSGAVAEHVQQCGIGVQQFAGSVTAADAVGSVRDEGSEIELGAAQA